jgi:DNA-binding transcriptional regulator YdaS (Cro superfamily)
MHLPLFKALVAVISVSVVAIGVALSPAAGRAHHPHGSATASRTTSREADGLQFLGQLAAGNVKPDAALKQSWMGDVTALADRLGLSDTALAGQLSAGRSLAQIAASRGVPTSVATTVLFRHVRDDLDRAEHDQAISPTAARALVNALSTALGNP